MIGFCDIGKLEIDAEGFRQYRRINQREVPDDFMCWTKISLHGPMGDGKFAQRLDFLEQSIAFLLLDDVSQQVSERADVAAQRLFLDVGRDAGKFVQPLMLVRRMPE